MKQQDVDQQLKKIGKRVRQLRKAEQKNYEVWAELKNVNKVTLQRFESGKPVSSKNLVIIIKHLNVTLAEFFQEID